MVGKSLHIMFVLQTYLNRQQHCFAKKISIHFPVVIIRNHSFKTHTFLSKFGCKLCQQDSC